MPEGAHWPPPKQLLPHGDAMVLLDAIIHWNASGIQCLAHSHGLTTHPLRESGRLSVYAGVEYGAQAMAAHARLLEAEMAPESHPPRPPARGFLAQASKLCASVTTLDQYSTPLQIDAWPLAHNPGNSLYQFQIHTEGHTLLEGRLTAIMERASAPS